MRKKQMNTASGHSRLAMHGPYFVMLAPVPDSIYNLYYTPNYILYSTQLYIIRYAVGTGVYRH